MVREEINKKEKLLIKNKKNENNIINNETSEFEEEREFTFEECLRIKHLDKKRRNVEKNI